jgi:Tol biopolymer transport system component
MFQTVIPFRPMRSRGYILLPLLVAATFVLANSATAQYTAPGPKGKASAQTLRVLPMVPHPIDNAAIDSAKQFGGARALPDSFYIAAEKHLSNIKQLSFSGENAEAYLSPDEKHVSFQARSIRKGTETCDQIYTMTIPDGKIVRRVSTGLGRTTCSYYLPSGDRILFASTHNRNFGNCPPPPDQSKGYVWPIYGGFDIFITDTLGQLRGRLTEDDSIYNAEATVSPKGDRIVFTSTSDGDLDLYSMKLDGSDVRRLTDEPGYDGGAFFSPDGSKIIYRASHPTGDELAEYKSLLKEGLVRPHNLEIYVMNADGTDKHQVTHLNAGSFAPYWHPDGHHVIFSSNYADPQHRDFDLFMIDIDGTGLERITYSKDFDGFPVFTRDGKHLIFCSNRNASEPHNTNIFIADWRD